jgi:1-acyl-sn-glycerol-3-phosphate acyltransferase
VLGAAACRAGYVASDGGHDALRAAAEKVAAGSVLIMFPEGTRSREGVLQPFKPGFILVARRAAAPIQLVRITGDSPLLVKGRPWWRIPPLPVRITVSLGPCLPTPQPADRTELLRGEIEAWFRAGTPPTARVLSPTISSASVAAPAARWQTAT